MSFDQEETMIVDQVKIPFQNTVTEFCNPGIPPLEVAAVMALDPGHN